MRRMSFMSLSVNSVLKHERDSFYAANLRLINITKHIDVDAQVV